MSTPGLFFVSSRITHPHLSEAIFHEWYNQKHIPDMFQTSGFEEAYRWKVLKDLNTKKIIKGPFLNTYPLRDVEFPGSEEFKTISVHDENFPGSGLVFDSLSLDIRCYKTVQVLEREASNSSPGQATFILIIGTTPPADLSDWEQQQQRQRQHDNYISNPSWLRTEHYKLTTARKDLLSVETRGDLIEKGISLHLTIVYFDGEDFPERMEEDDLGVQSFLVECCWYEKLGNFFA